MDAPPQGLSPALLLLPLLVPLSLQAVVSPATGAQEGQTPVQEAAEISPELEWLRCKSETFYMFVEMAEGADPEDRTLGEFAMEVRICSRMLRRWRDEDPTISPRSSEAERNEEAELSYLRCANSWWDDMREVSDGLLTGAPGTWEAVQGALDVGIKAMTPDCEEEFERWEDAHRQPSSHH